MNRATGKKRSSLAKRAAPPPKRGRVQRGKAERRAEVDDEFFLGEERDGRKQAEEEEEDQEPEETADQLRLRLGEHSATYARPGAQAHMKCPECAPAWICAGCRGCQAAPGRQTPLSAGPCARARNCSRADSLLPPPKPCRSVCRSPMHPCASAPAWPAPHVAAPCTPCSSRIPGRVGCRGQRRARARGGRRRQRIG